MKFENKFRKDCDLILLQHREETDDLLKNYKKATEKETQNYTEQLEGLRNQHRSGIISYDEMMLKADKVRKHIEMRNELLRSDFYSNLDKIGEKFNTKLDERRDKEFKSIFVRYILALLLIVMWLVILLVY